MSQQTDIFNCFSKFRIYNCIKVSQEYFEINNGYSRPINDNDTEAAVQFRVYTWFLYHSSHCCIEVNDINLQDSWVISAQGHFTKNKHLSPIKISNCSNGCSMKTVVRVSHWSLYALRNINKSPNGNVVRKAEGKIVDLLSVVLQQINVTIFDTYNSSFEKCQSIGTKFN
jgi:hypothetical protein